MRTSYGPPHLAVYELQPGEALICWRIVRSEHPDDPVFLNSLRSHYELSEEPRKVERTSHLTIWGDPIKLTASVVDIAPVRT